MLFGVMTVSGAQSATADGYVAQGMVWSDRTLPGFTVGVTNVGAEKNHRLVAELALLPAEAAIPWQADLTLSPGDALPLPGGAMLRLVAIHPPDAHPSEMPGSPTHGGIRLAASPGSMPGEDVMVLPVGGRLTIGDKDPMRQMVATVASVAGETAELALIAQPFSFGDVKPADWQHVAVRVRGLFTIGAHPLRFQAILPATGGGPMTLLFVPA